MTQIIGILLGRKTIQKVISGKFTHEKIEFYEEFAAIYGLKPIYFTIHNISLVKNTVFAYYKEGKSFGRKRFEIPRVIHNRGMYFKKIYLDLLKALKEDFGVKIFNENTRYRKHEIFLKLSSDERMTQYLPETKPLSNLTLHHFVERYNSCFIKPVSNSLGRGILKIVRMDNKQYKIFYSFKGRLQQIKCSRLQLWKKIKWMTRFQPHIIQQGIKLAEISGKPFDVRVAVQKNDQGKWQVTGMTTKVAKKGHFLTNVAQGGTAVDIEKALETKEDLVPDRVRKRISEAALLATAVLDTHIEGMADLGYDIGINEAGQPYIIELNGHDQRYSFEMAGETETWKNTFKNPMGYGKYLYNQMNKNNIMVSEAIVMDSKEQNEDKEEVKSLLPVIWNPFGLQKER